VGRRSQSSRNHSCGPSEPLQGGPHKLSCLSCRRWLISNALRALLPCIVELPREPQLAQMVLASLLSRNCWSAHCEHGTAGTTSDRGGGDAPKRAICACLGSLRGRQRSSSSRLTRFCVQNACEAKKEKAFDGSERFAIQLVGCGGWICSPAVTHST
jgi:hypothetical protein